MVVVGLGLCLLAGIGLMFDVSNMYAQRQLAQNAADAAALAAMQSIFNGTNTSNGTFNNTFGNVPVGGGNPSRLNCGSSDKHTPCYYARQNGFDPSFGDTVYVDFWSQANASTQEPGVSFSSNALNPVPLLRVTIFRPVPTTLIRLVGGTAHNVAAQASAGIVFTTAAVPILVLHPTLTEALSLSGNPAIKICGGPSKSIQINSCAGTGGKVGSVSAACQSSPAIYNGGSATIDLSKAGPLDSGSCTTGTGANLGNFGYPKTSPSGITYGVGKYIDPSAVIPDPFAAVAAPTTTAPATLTNQDPTPTSPYCTEAGGTTGPCTDIHGNTVSCPLYDQYCDPSMPSTCKYPITSCTVLKPGIYTSAGKLAQIKNDYVIFTPGIYYIQSGGLSFQSQGGGETQTRPPGSSPWSYPTCSNPDPCTGCGVLFYLASAGGTVNVAANAGTKQGISILGSDPSTSCTVGGTAYNYKGMVIFVDHAAPAQAHSFGWQWRIRYRNRRNHR
jgi:Flp pilus assembly protein TadG